MPNYEIMVILDPKVETTVLTSITKDTFGAGIKKSEKLDRTNLAYPIKDSNTATYMLLDVDTEAKNIAEFNRRVNITKEIWRSLVINRDAEKANAIAKPRPERKFTPRDSRAPRRNFDSKPRPKKEVE